MDYELTEKDIFDAFGIEPTEDTTGDQPEGQDQQAEETAADVQTPPDQQAEEPGEEQTEEPEKKAELTTEERRANAARRREKERKEAIDAAVAAEREKANAEKREAVDAVYRRMGYENEADYLAKQAEAQAELRGRAAKRLGLSAEEAEALFPQQVPQDVAASGQVETSRDSSFDQTEADEPFQGGQDALERQIAEISNLDPSIKSLADLQAKPWAAEMAEALNARQFGTDENRLLRAFKVYGQEDIIQARLKEARAAGRQEALNAQAGKEHLAPAKERAGQGLPEVPKETLRVYKQLMPGLSYEQYQKEYAKTIKVTR